MLEIINFSGGLEVVPARSPTDSASVRHKRPADRHEPLRKQDHLTNLLRRLWRFIVGVTPEVLADGWHGVGNRDEE